MNSKVDEHRNRPIRIDTAAIELHRKCGKVSCNGGPFMLTKLRQPRKRLCHGGVRNDKYVVLRGKCSRDGGHKGMKYVIQNVQRVSCDAAAFTACAAFPTTREASVYPPTTMLETTSSNVDFS